MKKIFSLFAVVLFAASMMADTVTFTAGTDKSTNTSITKDGITITATSFSNDAYYQTYKSQKIKFTSTVGNITNVQITCTVSGADKYGPGCYTGATAGTYTYSGTVGTWSGDAATFSMTASSNQVRMTQIVVTYTATSEVTKAPTFSVASGTYTSAQTVTISCATAGATIYYTLDGTEPTNASTVYSAPLNITSNTTLKAIAYVGANASTVASATYAIVTLTGAGTQANPYTVADVKLLNNNGAKGVWVVGTIVGVYNNSKPTTTVGTVETNIALATGSDTIPVQLPSGDIRDALNLKSHATLMGAVVKVKGDLQMYFNVPAVKNTSAYEIVSTPTSVNKVAVKEKAVKVFHNGKILIRMNGVYYSLMGVEVEY